MKYRGLIINPNSSDKTSQMMLKIVNEVLPDQIHFDVLTAQHAPLFIMTEDALISAEQEVLSLANQYQSAYDGIIIGAYGDPGLKALRTELNIPVTGLFEASFLEAKALKQKFAVVTITPHLIEELRQKAEILGVNNDFHGFYCTDHLSIESIQQSDQLYEALVHLTQSALRDDADVIILGGGPLGQLALNMRQEFNYSVISPLESAVKRLVQMCNDVPKH